ncbi:hypothetical protein JHK82_027902 [Glycine max]|nr:hypothetical protein JHK82_027902 [Glycine max]
MINGAYCHQEVEKWGTPAISHETHKQLGYKSILPQAATLGIRITVSNLLDHHSARVQDRARTLFDNWKGVGNGDTESHEVEVAKVENATKAPDSVKEPTLEQNVEHNEDDVCHKLTTFASIRTLASDRSGEDDATSITQIFKAAKNDNDCCSNALQGTSISDSNLGKTKVLDMSVSGIEYVTALKEDKGHEKDTSIGSDCSKPGIDFRGSKIIHKRGMCYFLCCVLLVLILCGFFANLHIFRKEISQLQKKEVEIKKVAARERAALGYISGNGNEKSNLDSLVKAIAGVSVTSQPEDTKVNKAKQRRDKKAQQEAEREQRIQAEQSDIISDRVIKNEKLENKFQASWLDCL